MNQDGAAPLTGNPASLIVKRGEDLVRVFTHDVPQEDVPQLLPSTWAPLIGVPTGGHYWYGTGLIKASYELEDVADYMGTKLFEGYGCQFLLLKHKTLEFVLRLIERDLVAVLKSSPENEPGYFLLSMETDLADEAFRRKAVHAHLELLAVAKERVNHRLAYLKDLTKET